MATLEELLAQAESEVALSQPVGTPGQQALQTGAGTALNFADTLLFGLPSKGIAAGQAIASDLAGYFSGKAPQDYYSQELAKVERLKAIGEAATSEAGLTGPTEALSFMAPLPGKKAEVLMSFAKPAKEAGLGLASYLGSEAGQALTSESPYGSLAGALAAPLSLQGLVGGIRRLSSALSPTLDVLKGREEALQQIASKELLKAAGEEGAARLAVAQQMPELLTSPLGRPLTAAEIAQTPGIANVQLQMAKNIEGGKPLVDALTAGKAEQELAMAQLGSFAEKGDLASTVRDIAAKQRGAEILGNEKDVLRNIDLQIQSIKPQTLNTPSELVKSLGADTASKITLARDETKAAARSAFKDPQVYNVTVDVPDIRSDVNQLVRQWKRTPTQTIDDPQVAKQIARLRKLDMPKEDLPKGFVPTVKIGELHDIQVKLGETLSGAKPGEYTPSQALARSAWQYIDNVMEKAPGSEKLFAAKAKYRDYFDTFIYNRELQRPSPLNQALKKTPEKVLPFLSRESFGVSAMQKANVGLDNLETLKLSEFANLPDAKKKLAWIEKNRPQLSDATFWPQMENYAAELKGITQSVKRTVGAFENITEGQIPTKIFGDEKAAAEFMNQFRGTEAELLARGKWIQQAKTARGGLAAQYDAQKKVVKQIFGSDTDKIEKIIKDIDLSTSPQRIAQMATGKQSITTQGMTTIGWLLGARSMLKSAKGLKVAGPAYALANWANPPAWLAGGLAYKVGDMASKSDAEIDRLMVEMLRDPSLIKFAAAPVSKANTEGLLAQMSKVGLMTKAEFEEAQPFVHGTTKEGKKAIEGYGGFIPKTVNYSVLGPGTIYAAKRNSWWFDPQETSKARMWDLSKEQIPVYIKPEAKVIDVSTYSDFSKLAERVGLSAEKLAEGLFYDPPMTKADTKQAKALKQKLIDSGVDAINITETASSQIQKQIGRILEKGANALSEGYSKATGKGIKEKTNLAENLYNRLKQKSNKLKFAEDRFTGPQLAIFNSKIAEPAEMAYERLLKTNPNALQKISKDELKMLSPKLQEKIFRLGYFGAKSQYTTDQDELAAQELLNSL